MVAVMKTYFLIFLVAVAANLNLMAQEPGALRAERDKLQERGMWREAVDFYGDKLMPVSDADSGKDLEQAMQALGRLNAWREFDRWVERAISTHPENCGLLVTAASQYRRAPHSGRIIAGEFERGGNRYGWGKIKED